MEEKILSLLGRANSAPLNVAELRARLGFRRDRREDLARLLARMERNGQIMRNRPGNRYTLPRAAELVPGRIRMNRQGTGFLEADDPRIPVIRIPGPATAPALHGDRVLVRREGAPPRARGTGAKEAAGRVVRVLERARTQLVGTLRRNRQSFYVLPDDPRIGHEIHVPPPRQTGRPARVNDKVVVRLGEWTPRQAGPAGEVIEALGPPDAAGVDMLSVIRQYQLPLHFPRKVLAEAQALGREVTPAERAGRVDCRAHPVITIDPSDAKDFDDAICLQRAGAGQWKLWVHIADVSHYVRPGSALDEEAARRGNSTYLVDRVVPMLPAALSEELCSLKPQVERLTQCVEFLLAADGRVRATRFYSAVIRSQRRYDYGEVLALLARPPRNPLEQMLHDAHALAGKIRQARFQAGALELDFPELKIRLDAHGRVLRLEREASDDAHQLIEEYMLLANEAAAGRLRARPGPAIYRVHEPPEEARLEEFRQEVRSQHIPCGRLSNRREAQKLLARLATLPIGPALKIGFLKSLPRARYAVEPLGHYGLAKPNYTHFTSPIRRYADLMVHRALLGPPGQPVAARPLPEMAEHLSATERNSDDAERDSREAKLFAFLAAQLQSAHRERYEARVIEVRSFGCRVDVPGLGLSGLVPAAGAGAGNGPPDARRGRPPRHGARCGLKLGDTVEVRVAKVDAGQRQVDFQLAEPARERRPKPGKPPGKAPPVSRAGGPPANRRLR